MIMRFFFGLENTHGSEDRKII